MPWNWERKDWPNFTCAAEALEAGERQFFQNAGVMQGSLKYMDEEQQQGLRVDLLSNEAYKTSEIV